MVRVIEAIVVLALLLFSFFVGVKYSDQVKERASWMFETKEEEVELPDLSNGDNAPAMEAPVDENGQVMDQIAPEENVNVPMDSDDSLNQVPPSEEPKAVINENKPAKNAAKKPAKN